MYISIPHAEHSPPLYICRLQNVASSTYLDLDNGNNVNGMKMNYRWWEHFIDFSGFCTSTGTKVQGLQYVDTSNQRWELRRVSRTGLEIQALVKANPFTSSDFGSYVQDGLCDSFSLLFLSYVHF